MELNCLIQGGSSKLRETTKTFKARLCIRDWNQEEGNEYEDTYAPVVKYESLLILFAVAAQLDLEIILFDVKVAYFMVTWSRPYT